MESDSKAICKATTKLGRPCRKNALEDGLCLFHSGKLDLAELGRKGGKARKRKQEEPGDRLERLAHVAIGELLLSSANATARASAARLVVDKLSASSPLSMELAKPSRSAGATSTSLAASWSSGEPRPRAGERVVVLPSALVEALVEWKARTSFSAPGDYVFATGQGRQDGRSNVTRLLLRPVVEAANVELVQAGITPIEALTLHGLRRGAAILSEATGATASETAGQLGHKNPTITTGIYMVAM
jgi:Phage integrase family